MTIRRTFRVGDYLMRDDESGFIHYRSEMRKMWDGSFRHKDNYETRHPQEFVKAKSDPRALNDIRSETAAPSPNNYRTTTVGQTGVAAPTGPASHLYSYAGIGTMIVDGTVAATKFGVR